MVSLSLAVTTKIDVIPNTYDAQAQFGFGYGYEFAFVTEKDIQALRAGQCWAIDAGEGSVFLVLAVEVGKRRHQDVPSLCDQA